MRHIGSLLVALVFAPSIFLLTGTGLSAFNSALDDNKAVDPLGALAAFGALLLAGVLYGILAMARLSPLGPGLAGLAAFWMSGWAMFDIASYKATFSTVDVHMGGSVGELGLGILLGAPLLATVTSPRRWRKHEHPPAAARPVPYPPAQQFHPAPQYAPPPDPTRQFPAQPYHQPLPDLPPPSLHYPAAAPVMAPRDQAPPLPKRVPAPPPAPPAATPEEETRALHPAKPPVPEPESAPHDAPASPKDQKPEATPDPPADPETRQDKTQPDEETAKLSPGGDDEPTNPL